MASVAQWVQGARPRTLPNSIAPVLVGWGAAAALGASHWSRALLALVVAVAMLGLRADTTPIRPPCDSMIFLQMARPIPVPGISRPCRRLNRPKICSA